MKNFKLYFCIIIGIFVIFIFANSNINFAFAEDTGATIGTEAKKTDTNIVTQTAKDVGNWAEKFYKDNKDKIATELTGVAFKKAVGYFLNQVAYDTATWLATGSKGQKPMFITEGWGKYLTNAADNAAGTYLEQLGETNSFGKFNLCEPDLGVKVNIGLGLKSSKDPKEPKCSFTELSKNWEKELSSGDFLTKWQSMFTNEENNLGQMLVLHTGVENAASAALNNAILARLTGAGVKDKTDAISGFIKTPASFILEKAGADLKDATKKELTWTGTAADAIDTFITTLAGKLMKEWFKDGLTSESEDTSYDWSQLTDYDSQGSSGSSSGVAGAKQRFRSLIEPSFNTRGDYNILSELTSCPDPTKAGPTNCVITDNFREAVTNKLTVAQAVKEGYLKSDGVFGFKADGYEPNYYDGDYPYRSMIILRKFRIIPVGWELAAQYIKDNTQTTGACNISDMLSCYDPDDDYKYNSGNCVQNDWCLNLVDPNWVLKAPLNYCKREGFGTELLTENVTGEGTDSKLQISRNDNYCADEQSCIKEAKDGSCELYGYCTEERRKWNFNSNACEPINNTCQTFRGRAGDTGSYLENTLDFGSCNANNVGCQAYCEDYDLTTKNYTCDATNGNKLFLDKDAEECDEGNEGCREFIRTKSGLGTNLFVNPSFEESTVAFGSQECSGAGVFGDCATHLTTPMAGPHTLSLFSATPTGLDGETYTLSLYAKDCGTTGKIHIGSNNWSADNASTTLYSSSNWQRFEVSRTFESPASNQVQILITGIDSTCLIDAVQVERSTSASAYSDYHNNGLIYEKVIPDYLADECYKVNGTNYELKDAHNSACDNYARLCNDYEAGCELYTSIKDSISVPAKVQADDYCAKECDGYNNYLQIESTFDSLHQAQFIPKKGKSCGAEYAGCDEFTNLDKVEQGGEALEYYTTLKQCVKPSDAGTNCSEFYTWEGSSETGYQLKVFNLNAVGGEPDRTRDDSLECNATIYGKTAADPDYNPDCREFYNNTGGVSYHLLSVTITCSEDCHPYRRTEVNIDESLSKAVIAGTATCDAAGYNSVYAVVSNVKDTQFHWDAANSSCYYCKANGEWKDQHNACIYMAIPGEGETCSASMAGCREYSGSSGNNMRTIAVSDFEGSFQNWIGVGGTDVDLSSDSLRVGGESLSVTKGAHEINLVLGKALEEGGSYYLTFLAKAATGLIFTDISLATSTAHTSFIIDPSQDMAIGTDWKIYKLNLAELDHAVDTLEFLRIRASGDFLIDDIRLIQITDRYYLLKNAFTIPESCRQDIFGNPQGEMYNIGCAGYRDRARNIHYLRRFSSLCQESAVGCEMVIDTHNSDSHELQTFNTVGNPDFEEIAADNLAYVVYDKDKACNSADKGCTRLGLPYQYGSLISYGDTFFKNDPDQYSNILCDQPSAGCEEWTSSDGITYFKDPGDQTCEWRQEIGKSNTWSWLKTKVKKCDTDDDGQIETGEDKICQSDDMCGEIKTATTTIQMKCLTDNIDNPCKVDDSKTFGYGGKNNVIWQPVPDDDGFYWAGLCAASESGCTEYIDPISKFTSNIIFNSNFSDIDEDSNPGDGWAKLPSGGYSQDFKLDQNVLYVLSINKTGQITIGCNNDIQILDAATNFLTPVGNSFIMPRAGAGQVSRMLYLDNDATCTITAGNDSGSVNLRKAVIDYQLKQGLDKKTCNGLVDFENGCVLFNERQKQTSFATLTWDADATINDSKGIPPKVTTTSEGDANVLLKVTPDRVCNQWLACRSYIENADKGNVCFDIGLCDSVDDSGNCNGFVLSKSQNQTHTAGGSFDMFSNMSGYAKAGFLSNSFKSDLFDIGSMSQKGEIAQVSNGSFELYDEDTFYPLGWTSGSGSWSSSKFTVINNPVSAQTEGVAYKIEGKGFLKYSPAAGVAVSEYIDVEPNTTYFVSYQINTANFHTGQGFDTIAAGVSIYETYDKVGNKTTWNGGGFDLLECDGTNFISPWINGCNGNTEAGSDGWQTRSFSFKVGPSTTRIKLQLYGTVWWGLSECMTKSQAAGYPPGQCYSSGYTAPAGPLCHPSHSCETAPGTKIENVCWSGISTTQTSDACSGNVYFDNIKIRPQLATKDLTPLSATDNSFQYAEQSCRLYPENNSLACDYYDDSLIRKKGWLGYCLEYDRSPGSSDACLLWAPLDKIKGEGIEEGAGYTGKIPVYYCSEAATLIPVEYRQTKKNMTPCVDDNGFVCSAYYPFMSGYSVSQTCLIDCGRDSSYICCDYAPTGTCRSGCVSGAGWYDTDGTLNTTTGEDSYGIKYYDIATDELFDSKFAYCTKVVQTVNSVGDNKYWSGRVYEGSAYKVPLLDYTYNTDSPPFGSIYPPTPVTNPYEWDGGSGSGNQPLDVLPSSSGKARAGAPYSFVNSSLYGYLGTCSLSSRLCYVVSGATAAQNLADCQASEGLCNTFASYPTSASAATPLIKGLFAQSYGSWTWDWTDAHYNATKGNDWTPPDTVCPATGRPLVTDATLATGATLGADNCAVLPIISNIRINDSSAANVNLAPNQFVNITFNSKVDSQQLPLVMYAIDWGDDEQTVVSGVEMNDRPNANNPHSFYHMYSYWDLKFKANRPPSDIVCYAANATIPANHCIIKPKVKIKDNWGWCNGNATTNSSNNCTVWKEFTGDIIVWEKK